MISNINSMLVWSNLKYIQTNKIINTTYIWLAVVPITAKLFSKLEDTFQITIGEKLYVFDLKLPFSWQLFFFSALCFVIGNLLFTLFAPKLVKEFNDYGQYDKAGKTFFQLESYMTEEMKCKHEKDEKFKIALDDGRREKPTIEDSRNLFWNLHNEFNISNKYVRYVAGLFYMSGFLLFSYVALNNVYWVFRQII